MLSNKVGDLDTITLPTLLQRLVDAEAAIASSSQGMGPSSTWLQSPDYQLVTHPDNSTAMCWAHLQPDPIAIHMFVRVRDTSDLQRGEHIYPYSDIRVQPRYAPVGVGPFTRYVRFVQPGGTSTAVTFFHVEIRRFDPEATSTTPAYAPLNATRVDNIQNVNALLTQDDTNENSGAFASHISFNLPREIEFDIGPFASVERVEVYGSNAVANPNENVKIMLLTAEATDTDGISIPPSVHWESMSNFMDASNGLFGDKRFEHNDIEVIFDNASMTKLMKVDRTDSNLKQPGNTSRTLFFTALFPTSRILVTGAVTQKNPDAESVLDFV
jgi:hypothetical protein